MLITRPVALSIIFILMVVLPTAFLCEPKISAAVKPVILFKRTNKVPVTVTAYSPRKRETDNTPFVTAFNKRVKMGTIAISRDLEDVHGWRHGDMVHLEGIGTFQVWDRMNKRFKRRVDVFFFKTKDAKRFGRVKTKAVKLTGVEA